jgi:two-component system sensor histidine kinase BaeS
MFSGLRFKFLLLLLGVVALSLSGIIVFRQLMIRDFTDYLEGESEDKVYWILAHLEGAYERGSGWKSGSEGQDALWILNLGFEMRLKDEEGRTVIDTEAAIEKASPLAKRRLKALSDYRAAGNAGDFVPHPLFLGGVSIGTLELRQLRPAKETVFVRRSDYFLLLSVILLGGLAVLLSILFSRRLTRPIRELAFASNAISRGDFTRRVAVTRHDEVGNLSEAFNRMAKDLETQESLRKKLIADVAHELRTPLGAMRGELEAMIDGMIPIDPDRLQSLYDETGRLKNMVDGIEELNQAEASVLSLNRQVFGMRPFLSHIVERYYGSFQEKGVSLGLDCDSETKVYADPDRLSQILLNLLSNALRVTDNGRVTVTARKTEEYMTLTVEDTGSGIKEEELPFVFERFYKGPGGGLGIGLTIVKELTEAHGGRVEVTSVYGRGSSFTIYLPLNDIHNSS